MKVNWRAVGLDALVALGFVFWPALLVATMWWAMALDLNVWARRLPSRLRARYVLDGGQQ